jgi:hypothetical protein
MFNSNTIRYIAEQIRNFPVVLYPCCAETLFITAKLKQLYNICPSAICDIDDRLSVDNYYQLKGLEILTIEQAQILYSHPKIFVTHSKKKFDIFDYLVNEANVNESDILNFEPYEKRRSCMDLECNLALSNGTIGFCCDGDRDKLPRVALNKTDYRQTLADISEMRNNSAELCVGCSKFVVGNYPSNQRIRTINHSSGGRCNFDCGYCSSPARHTSEVSSGSVDYMKIAELLSRDTSITTSLACGEITLHPDKEAIISKAASIGFVNFFTNASVYDSQIQQILDCNVCVLRGGGDI